MQQLDLFRHIPAPAEPPPSDEVMRPVIVPDTIKDDELLAALPHAGLADSVALAAEAGRRRIAAAVPALEALCRRFAGFGADRIVPEQAAALDALATIAGSEAAQALVRLIARRIVQGPCLQKAVGAAASLGAKLPAGTVRELLRHDDPQIRADACRLSRLLPEAVPQLRELLDDLHRPVRMAAACALGHMGRNEVRPLLARYLREEPSAQLIDAVDPVADEECVILLGRIARTIPDLSQAALDALDAIDHPRAARMAAEIREKQRI
ncbi:MAG TPA: HEAT repeat domain-containing protein [Stellaceae bacterium]|nr:HEAT repeat domain-containing protein [Stellaceae bacterium]